MNTRLLRKIIGLILAALLLTSIVLLAGTSAAAQRRSHRRTISRRSIERFEPVRTGQPVRPFHAYGPFGRPYHPFWDPYGRNDAYTFYRHSIGRSHN
jgi:hypothetical protein